MNLYEDASLEHTLDEISDQLGLLVLDLLLVAVQKARRETGIYQEFSEVKTEVRAETKPHPDPF